MVYTKQNKLHIVSVVAVIRNREGGYLVLKRRDDEIAYPGMYTFPGGKIEDNQTVEEALESELEEEAGLKLVLDRKILLKDKSFIRPDGQTVKVFSCLCEVENPDEIKISKDFTDYKWVTIKELGQLEHVGIEEELRKADELAASGVTSNTFNTKSVRVD